MAKFIANKKVSQSVQKYYRKNGVKNANLDTSLVLKKKHQDFIGTNKKILSDLKFRLKDKPRTSNIKGDVANHKIHF